MTTVCSCRSRTSSDADVCPGDHCQFCGSPRWGGRYSLRRLREACARLGIRRPVRVKCHTDIPPDRGGYHCFEGSEHVIGLSDKWSVFSINRAICHELTHAAQRELDPDSERKYIMLERAHGYDDNPYEREAREIGEATLAPQIQIAREGQVA